MSALYVLEKQPHIPQLQLYVNAPAARTALSVQETTITLRINPSTALDTNNDNTSPVQTPQTFVIPLDCRVKMAPAASAASAASPNPTPASLSVTKAATACLIRIPLHRAYTDATSSLSPSLPSAFEMQPASYPTLYCRRCLSQLLNEQPASVKPLPSSHWSELTDLWYCHNTNDNSHLDHIIQHAVKAKQHTLLVGREELRLSSGGVKGVLVGEAVVREEKRERTTRQQCGHAHHAAAQDEVKEEKKEQEQHSTDGHSEERVVVLPSRLYRQARCEQCEAELGWCVTDSSAMSDEREVWLHKHRITNVLPGETESASPAHAPHPLLSALSSLTVSSSSAASDTITSTSPISSAPTPTTVPSLFTRHYSVETYLSSQLLSICEARCSFRFILRSLSPRSFGSGYHHLHIVVLNIDTAITCPAASQPSTSGEMQTVLKVAYSGCEADVGQCKGEVVELSGTDMAEVEVVLQQQSEWLPVEFRQLDKQTLSYLRRLSSD